MIALFLVAVLSVTTVAALERSLTIDRRDKETQLLYAGQAIQTAIMQYYLNATGYAASYPLDLNTLLQKDQRLPSQPVYLRRLYVDPMTGSTDWGTIPAPNGVGIMGVYSKSTQQPIKLAGFPPAVANANPNIAQAQTYQQWQFTYTPP
jgi:type II secretory pathway pseudopilin PulG